MRGPSRARVAFALPLKFLLSCLALLTAVAWAQPQASLKIYTFAGLIGVGDGGPAIEAPLRFPTGVVVDSAGNLYIADRGQPPHPQGRSHRDNHHHCRHGRERVSAGTMARRPRRSSALPLA